MGPSQYIADIAYCLYPPLRLYTHIYHVHISFSFHSLISSACHSLLRVARGSNIFIQIMVTFLSYISNACHSLSGVAERLQHTWARLMHHIIHSSSQHGHLLNLIATPVTLCQGWQSGSRITPAPYEKPQASEEICKRAAHPSSKWQSGSNIHGPPKQAPSYKL